jgi:hypothetical protein
MTQRPLPLPSFSVYDACRDGLNMLLATRPHLARLAWPVLAVAVVNGVALSFLSSGGPLRLFLLTLPAMLATGWFVAMACRLWVLGETPRPVIAGDGLRLRQLQGAVLAYLVWKAAVAIYEQAVVMIAPPQLLMNAPDALPQNPGGQLILMVMMGILFWGLRLRLAPALIAAGYPLRDYMRRATGFMLSLRLLGLVLLCSQLPRTLLMGALLAAGADRVILTVTGLCLDVVLEAWLFAAFVMALRQMMGRKTA